MIMRMETCVVNLPNLSFTLPYTHTHPLSFFFTLSTFSE